MSKISCALDLSKVGRTNLYHSDEERRIIYGAICRTKEALEGVHEEKKALRLREEALQSDLERYLNAHAPIKRLPDDVLCSIFEWSFQDRSPIIPFYDIPLQITVSHVCSTWRQIMLNTPAFWGCITFCPEIEHDNKKAMEVARAWLLRAKSLHCIADIAYNCDNSVWVQDWYKNIVKDLISPYKFKRLDVAFGDHQLRRLLQLPDGKLRCIKDLRLRYVERRNHAVKKPFELFKLSSLSSFELLFGLFGSREGFPDDVGITLKDTSRFSGVPWHQLRHIKIYITFPALFCLKLLALSSDILETCILEVDEDESFISSLSSSLKEPIRCRQLRNFTINMYSSGTDAWPDSSNINDSFLTLLRCPKLRSLSIVSPSRLQFVIPRSVNLQTLVKFQRQSRMPLEELVIGDTLHEIGVLPLLASFPLLKSLVLPEKVNFTEEAMDELGSGTIAPYLEHLKIKKPSFTIERLLETIKARSLSIDRNDRILKHKPNQFKSITLLGASLVKGDMAAIGEIRKLGIILNLWACPYY